MAPTDGTAAEPYDECSMDALSEIGVPSEAGERTVSRRERQGPRRASPWPTWVRWVVPLAIYGLLGLVLWAGVWTANPTATTTCGCGDAARFLWFFEWPAYAIPHGLNPLFSTWLFHPTGINLLDDTSVVGLSIPLLPVTWLAGPVASMNVALLVAPVLSALAMYALIRRFTSTGAAFVAGLLFGFSPFMLSVLALNQLNIALLALPPLMVLVVDDLVRTKRRGDVTNAVLLAGLVIWQFFVSTEILAITAAAGLVGVLLLFGSAAVTHQPLGSVLRPLVRPVGIAAGIVAVVLVWPLWFLVAGPGHLTGAIWSNGSLSRSGAVPSSFVTPSGLEGLHAVMHVLGGYQGPILPGLAFVGWANVIVVVVGLVVLRRDRRLWPLVGLGVIFALLSLAPDHGSWVPWTTLQHVVVFGQIVEIRFVAVVLFADAFLLALIIDGGRAMAPSPQSSLGVVVALAAIVLVPMAMTEAPNVPLHVEPVTQPTYFATVGDHLDPHQVLFIYPAASSGQQASSAWQALAHMHFQQATGGGPAGETSRAGSARPGLEVLNQASFPFGPPPTLTPQARAEVRAALRTWRVTSVVVPDTATVPPSNRGRGDRYATAFFTRVLGRSGTRSNGATVWAEPESGW